MKRQINLAELASAMAFSAMGAGLRAGPVSGYVQTNLVSDVPGQAANTDPNLKNPWGISMSGSSPFWVADNTTGKATLYKSAGTPQALVVTIPGIGGNTGTPTGTVFASIASSFNGDTFLFTTEDGLIAGWRGALGTTAEILLDNSSSGAVYKGMAIGTTANGNYFYSADFHNNQITVVPGTGAPALTGNFTDPNLPVGYAPFNIQKLNGQLNVTYAKQDAAKHDEVAGAGLGLVDIYDLNGNLQSRFASAGALDAPWGLALTPADSGFPPATCSSETSAMGRSASTTRAVTS